MLKLVRLDGGSEARGRHFGMGVRGDRPTSIRVLGAPGPAQWRFQLLHNVVFVKNFLLISGFKFVHILELLSILFWLTHGLIDLLLAFSAID